jgi:outer membrane protein OmpA-like peptidoglycan-associated protein
MRRRRAFHAPCGSAIFEIAGYASSTGTKQLNQKLSEERAASAAKYLRETQNIPTRQTTTPKAALLTAA